MENKGGNPTPWEIIQQDANQTIGKRGNDLVVVSMLGGDLIINTIPDYECKLYEFRIQTGKETFDEFVDWLDVTDQLKVL